MVLVPRKWARMEMRGSVAATAGHGTNARGNLPPDVISLLDVDGVGLLCDGCSEARLSWRGRRYDWEDGTWVVLYCAACSAWQSCSTPTWDLGGDSSPVRLLCSGCCGMSGAKSKQIGAKGEFH